MRKRRRLRGHRAPPASTNKTDPNHPAYQRILPASHEVREPQAHPCTLDIVDEASIESFPASDPPGYTATHV